jgi:hypothetical protein
MPSFGDEVVTLSGAIPPPGVWSADMGEISGFGGGYEDCCRAMLAAGLKWLDEHPTADPRFHGYKNVYGLCMEDNEDAKSLSRAICDCEPAREEGATGAMHQAVVSHVMFIKAKGWESYVEQMRARERDRSDR